MTYIELHRVRNFGIASEDVVLKGAGTLSG